MIATISTTYDDIDKVDDEDGDNKGITVTDWAYASSIYPRVVKGESQHSYDGRGIVYGGKNHYRIMTILLRLTMVSHALLVLLVKITTPIITTTIIMIIIIIVRIKAKKIIVGIMYQG